MGHIVVGVDGSDTSVEALRVALREAERRDARVVAVLAYDLDVVGAGLGGAMVDLSPHAEQQAETTLRRCARAAGAGPDVELVTTRGRAASVLLRLGRDADLVVVGSRGLGGFRGLLFGSVSSQVVAHAGVPVLVVPSAAKDRDRDAEDAAAATTA